MNDAPRRWWNILDKALCSDGMIATRADRCCYVLYSTNDISFESRVRSKEDAAFEKMLDPVEGSPAKRKSVARTIYLLADDLFGTGGTEMEQRVLTRLREEFQLASKVSNDVMMIFLAKTIRISTMHVLLTIAAHCMIVAKTEESHGLRVNFVLCFYTLILNNKSALFSSTGNKAARYSTPILKASRLADIAVVFINTLPPCEILSNSPFLFRIHNTQAAAPLPLLRLAPSNDDDDDLDSDSDSDSDPSMAASRYIDEHRSPRRANRLEISPSTHGPGHNNHRARPHGDRVPSVIRRQVPPQHPHHLSIQFSSKSRITRIG